MTIEEMQEIKSKTRKEVLEEVTDLIAFADEKFYREWFPNEPSYTLYDLNAKYGIEEILKRYKSFGEIQIGDEIFDDYSFHGGVVIEISDNKKTYWIYSYDGHIFDAQRENMKKTGRHFGRLDDLRKDLREVQRMIGKGEKQ